MRCQADCSSGTIMMPALPGKSSGYVILCPSCWGTGRLSPRPAVRPIIGVQAQPARRAA